MDEKTPSLVERLLSSEQLPYCPFDRRSPDYWTSGKNNAPCTVCGGTEEVDKCRGADSRIMREAAARILQLEAALTELWNGASALFNATGDYLNWERDDDTLLEAKNELSPAFEIARSALNGRTEG